MKCLLASFLFLEFSLLFAFGVEVSKEITYPPLRDLPADSPKLQKILSEIVQNQSASRDNTKRLKISQHIDGSNYLADLMRHPRRGIVVKLELLKRDAIIPDDTWVTIHAEETGKVYQYTTVLGAKKTVPIWKESTIPAITNESILELLKMGNSYTIEKLSDKKGQCKSCTGSGKVYDSRSASRKKACKECGGSGKVKIKLRIKVRW